jgi:hypothetical protein
MSRRDTTPTDDDRELARELLRRCDDPWTRDRAVADLLGWRLESVRHARGTEDARLIAEGRALWEAYRRERDQ